MRNCTQLLSVNIPPLEKKFTHMPRIKQTLPPYDAYYFTTVYGPIVSMNIFSPMETFFNIATGLCSTIGTHNNKLSPEAVMGRFPHNRPCV